MEVPSELLRARLPAPGARIIVDGRGPVLAAVRDLYAGTGATVTRLEDTNDEIEAIVLVDPDPDLVSRAQAALLPGGDLVVVGARAGHLAIADLVGREAEVQLIPLQDQAG